MNKIKGVFLATNLADWKKRELPFIVLLMSLFPFFIVYITASLDLFSMLWLLRNFIVIALLQGGVQLLVAQYIVKHKVPNYLILSFLLMMFFFQLIFSVIAILIIRV